MAVLVRGGDWRLRRHDAQVKRTPLRRRSRKQDALMRERRAFVAEFLQGKRCELTGHSPCFGVMTVHEVVKRSHGGAIVPGAKADAQGQRFMALCVAHNGYVEDHPAEAKERGWA